MASQDTKTEKACPTCGASRESWDDPSGYDGVHCCEACADADVGLSITGGGRQQKSSNREGSPNSRDVERG